MTIGYLWKSNGAVLISTSWPDEPLSEPWTLAAQSRGQLTEWVGQGNGPARQNNHAEVKSLRC